MTISETLSPEFDQKMANTRRILECVPEGKFGWKPHEKSMTLGRLASHVAEMTNGCVVTITQDKLESGPNDKALNAATRSELLTELDKNTAAGRDAIAGASDGHPGKTWELFHAGEKIVMSHMIHHRGQLSVYLGLPDVPIPGMYGPSADMR